MFPNSFPDAFKSLFEITHDAVFLCADQKIVDWNSKVEELFGYKPTELIGQRVHRLPMVDGKKDELLSRLRAGLDGHPFESEIPCVHKSGREVPCRISAMRVDEDDGYFCIITVKDLSENREIEQELRTRTAQLQATLNSLPFDFWINDSENRTVMQNDHSKKLWGEQNGRHMEEVTDSEEIKKKWRETNERALRGEVSEEEQVYTIDGKKKTFRNIVAPILEKGEIRGILGLNIDITRYKNTENRLNLALEERETLLREVHHRVKNNLQLIISLLNLQKPHLKTEELGTVKDIEGRINTMAIIHNQLYNSKTLNRIDMSIYLENLSEAIRGMYDLSPRKIDIEVLVDAFSLPIEKALPIGIIVNELMSNSIRHGFQKVPEGKISVNFTTVEDPSAYRLIISDDGNGCEEVPAGDSSKGLGLTLVHQLTLQLQGMISFETNPGKGFSTSIIIPRNTP